MSDTPNAADDIMKVLDNGWQVVLFANALGSYTAKAINKRGKIIVTDDFTPSQALYRLAEKVSTGRIA